MNNPIKVLVVDDNVDFLNLMVMHLKKKGFSVMRTDNAIDALKIVRARPKYFDVLVTDWLMPGMSGNQLLRETKKINKFIQVILITSHSSMGQIGVMGHDAFMYLAKPLETMKELSAAVKQAYEHGQLVMNRRSRINQDRDNRL